MPESRPVAVSAAVLLVLAITLFGMMLFKHASYPLLWQDEAVTAMFGARVLEYGYPKVHGELASVYPTDLAAEEGIAPGLDAYRAAPWIPYYAAAAAELVARGAGDPWTRTGRLRGIFGALGLVGVALLLAAVMPWLGDVSSQRLAAGAYLLLGAGSVSFLLHLREVGPLAPNLLLLGIALGRVLQLQRARIQDAPLPGAGAHALVLVPLLFLLGATSTLAGLALLLTLLLVGLGRAIRRRPDALRLDLLPLLLAAALLYPVLAFHGPEGLRAELLGPHREAEAAYGAPLGALLLHLLRHEWLAPVVVARLVLLVLRRLPGELPEGQTGRLAAADLITLLVGVHLLLLAGLPVFLERNVVLLSPLLTLLLVLDGSSLLAWVRARQGGARRAGIACAAGVAVALLASVSLRGPELAGRFHEITNRYRGPLDHLVAYLLESYDDPSELVIATNAEGAALRYYLDSIVLVDAPTRLAQDFFYLPDVIVPRPSSIGQRQLGRLAIRDAYDQEDLAVVNLLANNVPTLSERDAGDRVHRFESAELPEGSAGLPVLELAPDAEADPEPRG